MPEMYAKVDSKFVRCNRGSIFENFSCYFFGIVRGGGELVDALSRSSKPLAPKNKKKRCSLGALSVTIFSIMITNSHCIRTKCVEST